MKKSKGRIVYVGPMSFPDNTAGTRRILGNALSLIAAGYEVIVGSGQLPKHDVAKEEDFQGISVYSVGERIAEDKPVYIKHLIYTGMGRKTVDWLNTLSPLPDAIILYGGDMPYLIRLIPWCRKRNIPLIFDAVEWYDPSNMPGGRFSPYHINFEITMRYYVPKLGNVITISSFLNNYFQQLGCKTICIPPTTDTKFYQYPQKPQNNELITIGYTGNPGKKDLFNNYLEALLQIDPDGEKFRFNIAGLTDTEVLKFPAFKKRKINILPTLINNIGKVTHEQAINLISNSNFSILLRYPKRYAQAGFPTKVVESMVMGTPVICNLTSDLDKYVIDGVSGIVCKNHKTESLIESLLRVKDLSPMDVTRMSIASRKIAEASFDYRNYITALDTFLNGAFFKSTNKNGEI